MKTGSILLFGVIAISLRVVYAAQSGELGSGMAGFGNGASVHIVTKAEPPERAPALKLSNLYSAGNGVLHRSVIDAANRTYFGYDLYAEPLAGARQCRVAILPLTTGRGDDARQPPSRSTSATAGGGNPIQIDASYRAVFLPNYPGPQVVGNGDTIALDLLTTPDGRQKVVDYIDVSCKVSDESRAPTAAARDASLDDLEIAISDPSTYVDGTLYSGATRGVRLSGSLVWFYFPGKGRFILSVVPRQDNGFTLAGTIHNNVISFKFGASQYEVKSATAILGQGRQWNLYVLFDPSYVPKSSSPFGSAMRLEQLLSNH